MSEEEKEAIWYCSEILDDNENDIEHWKIVKNLIDKLQKENEELKGIKSGTTIEYIGKATYWRKDKIEKYFISKDTIRDKIKELENHCFIDDEEDYAIEVLQELLEEGQNGSR